MEQALVAQLGAQTDPALALHLAVTLLVLRTCRAMVHAPGRCVPALVALLKDHVPDVVHGRLHAYQQLVVKSMHADPTVSADARSRLMQDLTPLKELVLQTTATTKATAP